MVSAYRGISGPAESSGHCRKLDYLAEIGLPIKVTEFDMNVRAMNISEADQAKEYAKVLRTCFSHPAIEGFLFWGFWDARHWCPELVCMISTSRPVLQQTPCTI